jgi:ATP-binding cassette subfamily B protein
VVALGLACLVLSNAAGIATPWLLGRAIDTLGQAGNAARDIAGHAALIVGAAAFSGFARFWMRLLLNSYSRRVEFDLRNAFFDRLLHLDAAFYGGTRTGDLMTRATNDTQAVRMAVGPGVMYFANTVVMTALALAVMIPTSASRSWPSSRSCSSRPSCSTSAARSTCGSSAFRTISARWRQWCRRT